jgi:hypothetical protein
MFPQSLSYFIVRTLYSICGGRVGVLVLIQINSCPKVPLQVNFLDADICIVFYDSYLSTG